MIRAIVKRHLFISLKTATPTEPGNTKKKSTAKPKKRPGKNPGQKP
jgi:hypothetical protein